MKPRTCYYCKQQIPVDKNFRFDENLNLICGNCNRIVYPTTTESKFPEQHEDNLS